jgi:hypothetical protein
VKKKLKMYLPIGYEIYMIGLFFVACVPSLEWILDRNNFFVKYYPLIGIVPFCLNLVVGNKIWKKKSFGLFSMFLLCYAITTIINLKYSYAQNVKQIFWIFLFMVIIYTYDTCFESTEKYLNSIYRILNVVIVYCLLLNIASIVLLFGNVCGRPINGGGIIGYLFSYGRHYGATTYSLDNARLAAVCLFIPIIQCINRKINLLWKTIYIINGILSIIFIWGIVSRGTYIMLFVILFALIFGIKYLKNFKYDDIMRRICKSFLWASLSLILVAGFAIIGGKLVTYIPKIGGQLVGELVIDNFNGWEFTNVQSSEMVTRKLLDTGTLINDINGTNNSWEILKYNSSWVFGIGVGNESFYKEAVGLPANARFGEFLLVNYLFVSGVCGTVFLIAGCVNLYLKSILCMIKKGYTIESKRILLVLAVSVGMIVYTRIMFSFVTTPVLFWIFLGCLSRLIDEKKEISI